MDVIGDMGAFADRVLGEIGQATRRVDIECFIVRDDRLGLALVRDVLLNRVPTILAREIYAVAALLAAVIQVVADVNGWFISFAPWLAIAACLVVRFLAVRYSWGLPVIGRR